MGFFSFGAAGATAFLQGGGGKGATYDRGTGGLAPSEEEGKERGTPIPGPLCRGRARGTRVPKAPFSLGTVRTYLSLPLRVFIFLSAYDAAL